MSFTTMLNQTASILRFTEDASIGPDADRGGWTESSTSACRIEALGGRELNNQTSAVVATHRVYLPFGTDITEQDRVTIGSVTYDIEFVDVDTAAAGHHCEVLVKAVT